MNPRDREAAMLARCADAARGTGAVARNQQEANVFRLAATVVYPRFPHESQNMLRASEAYFAARPNERLEAAEVVRKGWVCSLPRLRDMLSRKLISPAEAVHVV